MTFYRYSVWRSLTGFTFLVICSLIIAQDTGNDFQVLRERMVSRDIEARGVKNKRVLAAMRNVPRHLFVPENLQYAAYYDRPLPIGHNQTISQPFIVAYMTELLKPENDHIILEIGTGSGYQAAVLAKLVKYVYTIEIIPELGQEAEGRLKELGFENVKVRIGDGYQGWPEFAPFDRIIVTAAPEEIPPRLVEQLKPGGRMVIPTGPQFWGQDLIVLEKALDGTVTKHKTIPVRFVPMVRE